MFCLPNELMNEFRKVYHLLEEATATCFARLCAKAIEGKRGFADARWHESEFGGSFDKHVERAKQEDTPEAWLDVANLALFRWYHLRAKNAQ